jgi:hypothetical protein
MAKKSKNTDDSSVMREWREGDLIQTFKLNRIVLTETPLMTEWLDVETPTLNSGEQYVFEKALKKAKTSIVGWNEEDLKMKFISKILELGGLMEDDNTIGYFDKIISATIEDIKLTVKSDFMLATGILDVFRTPYFHFQEYKPYKNPSGDSMAQLLEAFLIAQEKNKNGKPIYGADIMGANWRFVIMEGKDYCISQAYDSVNKTDLMMIIAILRKFKFLLDSRLLDLDN